MKSIRQVMQGNLLIFTLGDAMRQLSMFVTFPYFSLYVLALGGDIVDIGIVNSLRPLAALFIYPIAGYLSDNYSRVKIIAATGFITAFLYLFFIFATDWRLLAVGNLLMGFMTFYFPAANSLMADSLPPDKRGAGYSLWFAIPSAVGIVSPYIGGYLTTILGVEPAMRLLYGLTLTSGLVIATMNLKFLREPVKRKQSQSSFGVLRVLSSSYKEVFETLRWLPRSLKFFAVLLIMSFFFNNFTSSYWVVYSINHIGLSKLQWGTVLLISAVVNVVLLFPAGLIVDRAGVKRVLMIALLISAIPVLLFPYSRGFLNVVFLFIAINLANSFLTSAAPAFMTHSVPIERRGRTMAALGQGMLLVNIRGGGGGGPGMGAVLTIPSILGFLLGGLVYDYEPKLPWILLGASLVVSAFICVSFILSPARAISKGKKS